MSYAIGDRVRWIRYGGNGDDGDEYQNVPSDMQRVGRVVEIMRDHPDGEMSVIVQWDDDLERDNPLAYFPEELTAVSIVEQIGELA